MIRKLILVILILLFAPAYQAVQYTGANLSDIEKSTGNTLTAGCWSPPAVPVLKYPEDNAIIKAGSAWDVNPYLAWEESKIYCPNSAPVYYQYESYHNVELTVLAYRSGWLSGLSIPAPGTPEGTYYWRVRAKDSQGYISAFSIPWLLIVDRTAPHSTISSPSPDSYVIGSPIHITGISHDDFGVASVDLLYSNYVSGSCQSGYTLITTLVNSPITNDFSWSYDFTPSTEGSYCIKAQATDRAGNKESSPVVENVTYSPNNSQEASPSVSLSLFDDKKSVSFVIDNIKGYRQVSYELTYDSDLATQGVVGNVELEPGMEKYEKVITLGTCSTGESCVYHQGVKNFYLKVELVGDKIIILEKSL